jgi:hypothetical protein
MGDLREGVHAGVGAARAVQPQRLFSHLLQRALDDVLHRVSAHL